MFEIGLRFGRCSVITPPQFYSPDPEMGFVSRWIKVDRPLHGLVGSIELVHVKADHPADKPRFCPFTIDLDGLINGLDGFLHVLAGAMVFGDVNVNSGFLGVADQGVSEEEHCLLIVALVFMDQSEHLIAGSV